ncbi:aminodeoxychorismate synthase component I [Marinicella litoralis]|uniref:Anthranilate synthase component 1 n=1 Tax=Marinicella litoralis TaxID=644220 RepID=A0A4R6XF57_9GAMM|nr:aminodeoxychorismate synthase component I [Marinicella litoralis]TDR16304.1 anthranilate synthase component 1 [Marinicella litoralis]
MISRKLSIEPDLLACATNESGFFPALLESQSLNNKIGCYDILFAAPATELVAYDQQQLNQLLNTIDTNPNQNPGLSPFQYGWLVYLSYESAYLMEPKLTHLITQTEEPLAIAIYCQGSLVKDHSNGQCYLFAASEEVAEQILHELDSKKLEFNPVVELNEIEEEAGLEFEHAVRAAQKLIKAGDIYQANLSRQYICHANAPINPVAVYAQLKISNPAPFAVLMRCNHFAVVSSSPERLLSIKGGLIETRPIAGTRPRGMDKAEDDALIKELIDTPKERAEHIMLIDLERNDIGKVCEIGSVEVDELMAVETYQHVHHIVSNVKGRLSAGVSVVDAIKALFPGGTITGCPKIRCMEVIHQIENRNRSAYTGSIGYINHDGQVDFNILIRTFCINGQSIKFNAGAGIVFDSDPVAELAETRHKAKGMLNALVQP